MKWVFIGGLCNCEISTPMILLAILSEFSILFVVFFVPTVVLCMSSPFAIVTLQPRSFLASVAIAVTCQIGSGRFYFYSLGRIYQDRCTQ